jgi:hypothetical protein
MVYARNKVFNVLLATERRILVLLLGMRLYWKIFIEILTCIPAKRFLPLG